MRFEKNKAVIEEQRPGKRNRTLVYTFDELINYINPSKISVSIVGIEEFETIFFSEYGVLESRTITKIGVGHYKMKIKTKAGKTGGYDMKFAEHGIHLTAYAGDLTATAFYR